MCNLEVMDPKVQNLFYCAEKVGLPVIYDGSDQKDGDFGLYDDPGLPQLEYTLQDHPKLKIFGHGPVFWNEIGKLETVAQRGVYMSPYGRQYLNLPKGPIYEEGTVPKLLRRNEAQIVASDCHDCVRRPPNVAAAMDVLRKKLGEDSVNRLIRRGDELAGEE